MLGLNLQHHVSIVICIFILLVMIVKGYVGLYLNCCFRVALLSLSRLSILYFVIYGNTNNCGNYRSPEIHSI